MTLGQIIKRYRTKNKMSMDEFANRSGLTKGYISMLEKNKNPSSGKPIIPSLETIKQVSDAVGTPLHDILALLDPDQDINIEDFTKPENTLKIKNIEDILQIQTQKIPLIGDIACGVPNFAEENFESYVELGAGVKADFALRCHGDSMVNARIMDGDIVFIKKQDYINNGEIAAVLVEEEATLKRVYITDTTITLLAENAAYPPTIIDRRDDSDMIFKILGKAVAFQSDVK